MIRPSSRHRREQRRARADAMRTSPRAARATCAWRSRSASPLCSTASVVAEARAEARHELRRERDLRHQHQRALPGAARGGDDAQVHLGLARPGHAVEQERRALPERRDHRGDRDRLRRRRHQTGARRPPSVGDAGAPGGGARCSTRARPAVTSAFRWPRSAALSTGVGIPSACAPSFAARARRAAARAGSTETSAPAISTATAIPTPGACAP